MSKIRSWVLLLVIFAFTNTQCEKSKVEMENKLPPETQNGKNTFGCLVNGKVWLPRPTSLFPAVNTQVVSHLVTLAASTGDEAIVLAIQDFEKEGTYSLSTSSTYFRIGGIRYSLRNGDLVITKIDYSRHIVSGRFSAVGENDNQTVSISDGRFDLIFHN